MYLSRVIIRNYKSIDSLNLEFKPGKNIIVGKNNSGKSNIVSAINLILGEASPTYNKSSNITIDDFHMGNMECPIIIYCELAKYGNESLGTEAISNMEYGFYRYSESVSLKTDYQTEEERLIYDTQVKAIFDINADIIPTQRYARNDEPNKKYISLDSLDDNIYSEFEDASIVGYLFRAYYKSEVLYKEIRLVYRNAKTTEWTLGFKVPIRTNFLQSAIIPSFRDTYSQLKLNNYSWYGKLLKHYLSHVDPSDYNKAVFDVQKIVEGIFEDVGRELNSPGMNIAFPNTKIKLVSSPRLSELYENISISVNDGYESPLITKGSGIQSAVIISLFNHYVKEVLVNGSALLVIEEPELYLHPHGRRVIAARLDDFLGKDRHQVIITTHASEYFTEAISNVNLIRVSRIHSGKTEAFTINQKNIRDLQIILKSQNAEMLFADKVILVEGADKYILNVVAEEYGGILEKYQNMCEIHEDFEFLQSFEEGNDTPFGDLSHLHNRRITRTWLSENNISIISVSGKGQFKSYVDILSSLNIKWYVMTDFDFLIDGWKNFVNAHIPSSLREGVTVLLTGINEQIHALDNSTSAMDFPPRIIELLDALEQTAAGYQYHLKREKIESYLKSVTKIRMLNQISTRPSNQPLLTQISSVRQILRKNNIFVLSGDLENIYTDEAKTKLRLIYKTDEKKEQQTLYLLTKIIPCLGLFQSLSCSELWVMLNQVRDDLCQELL